MSERRMAVAEPPAREIAGPVISKAIPQEVAYDGQQFIELKLAPTDFIATARGLAAKKEA